jgi:glucose-1-phosphate adenylyltransferase
VYKMNYGPMLAAHCAARASATVGCIEVPAADARRFGVLALGQDGRIERFLEKPQANGEPATTESGLVPVSMGIYVFDYEFLARILTADARTWSSHHDFGIDVLPHLAESSRLFAFPFRAAGASANAYWRDVGTLNAYWRAHMDLLPPKPLFTLDDPSWPIGSSALRSRTISAPAATSAGGEIAESIVCDTGAIRGRLVRCVASTGVCVADGAEVAESVLLPGAAIAANSRLRGVIVDSGYHVAAGTVVERDAAVMGPAVLAAHGNREGLDPGASRPLRKTRMAHRAHPGAQSPHRREQPP